MQQSSQFFTQNQCNQGFMEQRGTLFQNTTQNTPFLFQSDHHNFGGKINQQHRLFEQVNNQSFFPAQSQIQCEQSSVKNQLSTQQWIKKNGQRIRINTDVLGEDEIRLLESIAKISQIKEEILNHNILPQQQEQQPRQSPQQNIWDSQSEEKFTSRDVDTIIINDPHLLEKQEILSQIHEFICRIPIRSTTRKHSILEDALQLCILYLPSLRGVHKKLNSQQLFLELKQRYSFSEDRTFEGFKRRFHHLKLYIHSWTLESLNQLFEILVDYQEYPLDSYYIDYDTRTKSIRLPNFDRFRRGNRQFQTKQLTLDQFQLSSFKQPVISVIPKRLSKFVGLSIKEIEQDMGAYDDELEFIEKILEVIKLAE